MAIGRDCTDHKDTLYFEICICFTTSNISFTFRYSVPKMIPVTLLVPAMFHLITCNQASGPTLCYLLSLKSCSAHKRQLHVAPFTSPTWGEIFKLQQKICLESQKPIRLENETHQIHIPSYQVIKVPVGQTQVGNSSHPNANLVFPQPVQCSNCNSTSKITQNPLHVWCECSIRQKSLSKAFTTDWFALTIHSHDLINLIVPFSQLMFHHFICNCICM